MSRLARSAHAGVRRAWTAAAALLGLAVAFLLSAGPALAADGPQLSRQEGAKPGRSLSTGDSLLYFVGAPLLVLLVISAVVWLPGMVRSERYRPGKGWGVVPVWFSGPLEPVAAVEAAVLEGPTVDVVRGGASGSW